jgi:hypothetical protein
VLQARPTKTASTRFLYIAPCVRDTLPWQGGLLSRHHRWIPGCLSLYPSPSIRLGLGLAELINTGLAQRTFKNDGFANLDLGLFSNPSETRLFTSSSRIRAVPGTQHFASPVSGQKAALTGEQCIAVRRIRGVK